jgi:hypothetical protein
MPWTKQAIYFMTLKWTPASAHEWMKKHDYKPCKPVHRVGGEMRWRLCSPRGFTKFRTLVLPNGVHIVSGYKPKANASKKK